MSVKRAIVLGSPRSGTTFLMGVLDTLPTVESVSGNLLPVGIAHLAAQELPDFVREELERSFRGALADYLVSGLYHSRSAALRKWWTASRSPSSLPRAAAGRRTEILLAYKEPFLAFAPELAYEAFPAARILYIYRDGRDVADSLVRSYDILSDEKLASLESNEMQLGRRVDDRYVPWWVGTSEQESFLDASPYLRAIWMWAVMTRRCHDFFERADVDSKRVLAVRYEDLIADPLGQGKEIARHLEVSLTSRTRKRLQSAHARSIGAHRQRDQQEILAAEQLAAPELEALGYQLSGDPAVRAEGAGAGGRGS